MEHRGDVTSSRCNFEEMELRSGRILYSTSILDFEVLSSRFRVLTTEHRTIENRTLDFVAPSSSVEFEYRVLRTEHRTIEYRTLELDINSYLHVVPNRLSRL